MHEQEKFLKTNEICLNKRIGILKPSILNTKSRYVIYKSIIRSKYSYAVAILCYFNPEYTKKWESIIYRIVKRLFCIKSNISKDSLFKILNIVNISTQINNTINKIKGIKCTNNNKHDNFTENLSLKSIKFRLNCIFNAHKRKRLWNCDQEISNQHIVETCPKTESWRRKWNNTFKKYTDKTLMNNLMANYKLKKNKRENVKTHQRRNRRVSERIFNIAQNYIKY